MLRALRLERGLSQERLAEASGLHQTYVSLLERGRNIPTSDVVFALAHALDLSAAARLAMTERMMTTLQDRLSGNDASG